MWEGLHLDFIKHAILASVFISILGGIIGTYVVVNRIAFITGGIAHAAYGGVGISVFLGLPVFVGTLAFSWAVGLLISQISFRERERSDTIIGVIWAMGMALGIIFLDLTPGYKGDILNYLFGNILMLGKEDLYVLAVVVAGVLAVVTIFYKEFMAVSFDQEFSIVVGIPAKGLYTLLISLIALSVVTIIKIVGLLLVVAILTIPPYIASRYVNTMGRTMFLSSLLTLFFCVLGIQLSYRFNLPTGATIILVSCLGVLISRVK